MRRRKTSANELPILGHIKELRKSLLVIAYAIAGGAFVGWFLTPYVFDIIQWPAAGVNPDVEVISFISLDPLEILMVKLKLSMVVGIFIMVPIIFWQIWSFLLPALKKKERKYIYTAVPWSVLLFLAGGAFCFFVVLPMSLNFFVALGQETINAEQQYSVKSYVNFVLRFVLSFGLIFELPVVLLLLTQIGILTPQTLAKKRKYALFFIVVAAVIISPTPDIWTLLLMIVPMYFLYEVSIWLGKLIVRRKEKAREMEEAQ